MPLEASNILPEMPQVSPGNTSEWFDAEVRPHEGALRAYLRGRFPSLPDQDDIIQETYIRLIRAWEANHVRSPKSLLFTTARNVAVDCFRRRIAAPNDDVANLERFSVLQAEPSHVDQADTLSREQKLRLLEEAIQSLPAKCRQVIVLKKIEGLSYDEISQRLGISHNTISAHLTVGVTKCRDFLRAHGVTGGDGR